VVEDDRQSDESRKQEEQDVSRHRALFAPADAHAVSQTD
jgi:hypothetical protein